MKSLIPPGDNMIPWSKAKLNPEKILQGAKGGGAVIITYKGLPDTVLLDYRLYEAIYKRIQDLESEIKALQDEKPRRDVEC
jgi:prevent-host-death family protein